MRKLYILFIPYLFFSCSNQKQVKLPPKKIQVDNYFGQKIQDPYRYMENLEDTTLIAWLKSKNVEAEIIHSIKGRSSLLEKISGLNSKTASVSRIIRTYRDYYFYLKNDSKEESSKLFYKKSLEDTEELLYDPRRFKPNSDKEYIINYIKPSWDGLKVLISLTESDKEISEMIIIDVTTKKVFPQILDHCWPSELGGVKWLPDNTGIIYVYLPTLDKNSKEYLLNTSAVLYKIGDDSSKRKTLFSKKNNSNFPIKEEDFCEVTLKNQNDKYIFSYTSGATPYINYYYSLTNEIESKSIKWKTLYTKNELIRRFLVDGDSIIYMTSKNASNFKICKTSIESPNYKDPIVLVEEDSLATISDIAITKDGLFFVKNKNGVEAKLFHLNKNKEIKEVSLPKSSGYINVSSKGADYKDMWIEIEGWTSKRERYNFDFNNQKFISVVLIKDSPKESIQNVVIEEIEIPSHDGVMVPLSIIYKKGLKKNKNNRLLINGYGAYGWSNSPYMYPQLVHWVEEGGVYAIAHVRGGGEKGSAWHKDGYKTTKPNTWKDLIACTEYLINGGYTTPSKVATWSASAGGICVGRAITERPDLYAAAMIRAGSLNLLRSENTPNGKNNVKEFGSVKDSIEFKALYNMDAYHSVKNNTHYPSVLLTAGMNDSRVPVWESAKFAARIQESSPNNTMLLSVDFEGGHSFDAAQRKRNREVADFISFALWQTGHPDYKLQD